ncbi:MAG TPA: response regulator [Dyella sp.]|nr:response regulator [Dyella sp.]
MMLSTSARRGGTFVAALLVLVAIAVVVNLVIAATEQRVLRRQVEAANGNTVGLIARTLGDDLARIRGDVVTLAQTLVAEQALQGADPAMRQRAARLLGALATTRGDYAQLRFIGADGREVVRVDSRDGNVDTVPPDQLQDKRLRPYVSAIAKLGAGEVYLSRIDLNVEHGQIVVPHEPTLRVGTPVFSDDGRRLGMVVANVDGSRLLQRFAADARQARGSVWLTDADGHWLHGPDPARDWRFALPGAQPAGLATEYPAVWSVVRGQRQGQARGTYGLLSFDQLVPADTDRVRTDSAAYLRIVALAADPSLAAILFNRAHLIGYALGLPALLLLAALLAYLQVRLSGVEAEVAANSRLLKDIFDHSRLSMKVKDLGGRIVRANEAAGTLLGRPPEQLVGQAIDAVATADTAALIRQHDREVIETGEVTTYEEEVKYIGGSYTLLTTRFPVTDERGNVVGVGAMSLDITPRIRMEQWLRVAKDQAEAANVAKAAFLANMSHELRTPLNSIIGLGELLEEQALEEDADALTLESLRRVVGAGRHLLGLVNDILDISRIDAGRVELAPEPVLLSSLAESVLSTLQPLAVANGNTLSLVMAKDPGVVAIDAMRMRQVLINLLGNAIKFTRDGRITLRLERDVDTLRIAVTDTGIGMAPEQMERVFVPFEQADHSIARRFGGSGLGLAISRQLVELMGGWIGVESEPGRGSTFTVSIPVGSFEPASGLPVQEVAAEPLDASVLVVDDDEDARRLLVTALERHGLRVATACSGVEALQQARIEQPAVMLLDILLGDMSGWDVLAALRADPQFADLPVILCTVTDPDHRTASLGVVEHLTKPVDRDRLVRLVGRFVSPGVQSSVLVVDDDDHYREQLAMILRRAGCRVRTAGNGQQALLYMEQEPPDLVLLDLVMPVMDGLAVIGAMRERPDLAAVHVVLVTAADVPAQTLHRLNERAVTLVRKAEAGLDHIARHARDLLDRVQRTREPSEGQG